MTKLYSLITLPMFNDDCQLIVAQSPGIPFSVQRVYYILKPASGLPRGQHAHRQTKQVLFCLQGQVRMKVDNGVSQEEIVLSTPNQGIVLQPMIWHEMLDMTPETILLVLASEPYVEADYIRDYSTFKRLATEVV